VGRAPYVVAEGAASNSVTMGAAMDTGAAMVVIAFFFRFCFFLLFFCLFVLFVCFVFCF